MICRKNVSVAPPGGNATTKRTGRSGYVPCACASGTTPQSTQMIEHHRMKCRISLLPRILTGCAIRPRADDGVDRPRCCGIAALSAGYSALMPLASMKRVQFLISLSSFVCIAAAGMTSGVMSSLARRSRTSGSAMTFATAWASLALTASGMPFGPKIANQKRSSTSAGGTPASCMVGTSGIAGERVGWSRRAPRTLPLSTRPLAACTEEMVIGTWPAITSPIAWPPPL